VVVDSGLPAAVVVGLDSTQGLQTARILNDRGIPVIGVVSRSDYYASKTRVCRNIIVAKTNKPTVIDALVDLGPSLSQKAVLIPCLDMAVKLVSDHREVLDEWYHVNLPRSETVDLLLDKVEFYQYAEREGLPVPKTRVLRSRADAERAAEELAFPCIVKPPWRPNEWVTHTKSKAFHVSSPDELLATYDTYGRWADALIAQDWVPGGDDHHYSCNTYSNSRAELLVSFVSQKLRQWEPVTGRGCLAVEARNDTVLNETLRLLSSLSYTGLGYLEMKRHTVTGEHFIIEPNVGRPTGRAAMAEAAGVELMYTMYCDTLGLPLPDNRHQRYEGVKWVHLLRDLQASLYYWRAGSLTFLEWVRSLRGKKAYAILSVRDPRPFATAVLAGMRLLRSRRGGNPEDLA
jgi:predicted ATP-grasp superfamily ATP-dependent carboligase